MVELSLNSKIYLRKRELFVAAVINFPPSFSGQVFFVFLVVFVWFGLVSSEREIHCTTSPISLRNRICQKHSQTEAFRLYLRRQALTHNASPRHSGYQAF